MKQKYLLATVLICTSLIVAGYIKSNEYLQRLDDIGKCCKLKTLIYTNAGNSSVDTLVFHYNILGDPDSATYPPGSTLANLYTPPRWESFEYDSLKRMIFTSSVNSHQI